MKNIFSVTTFNREERRERTISTVLFNVRSIVLVLMLMLAMVAATTVLSVKAFAVGETSEDERRVEVATYDQLQTALENTQGINEIVIDPQAASENGDVTYSVEDDENSDAFYIAFDGPLTVSHDITIKSADDVDVYFARSASFRRDQGKPALLNVDPTGSLNVEGLITMTGEEVVSTFNEGDETTSPSFTFSVKSKDGTGEDNEAWNRGQVLEGGYYIQNNGGRVNLGDDVILNDFHTTDDVEGVEAVYETTADGLLFAMRGRGEEETDADEEATDEDVAEENEEETVEENTEEATEEITEETKEETPEEITEEKAEEKAPEAISEDKDPEEAPVAAPKRALKSMGAPALMQNSQNGGTPAKSGGDATPNDPTGIKTVATFDQLKAALADKNINTIIIDKTGVLSDTNNKDKDGNKQAPTITGNGESGVFYLPIDEPLTVNRRVEIKTKDANTEVIIARSNIFKLATDNNSALFNVTSSGDLTLSSKITMTGDQVKATYNAGQGYEAPVVKPIEIKFDGLYLNATKSGNVFNITLSITSGVKFWIEGDGHLACTNPETKKTNYLRAESKTTYSLKESMDETNDVRVVDENGNYVKTLEAGKTYRLINGLWTNAKKEPYYVIIDGDDLNTTTDANDSRIISFSVPATDENGGEIISAGKDYIAPSFKFEVTEKVVDKGTHWQTKDVKAGGFFVNVNAGKLTVNDGVTLRNLECGPNVSNVAPIVVKGDSNSSKADDGRKNFVMNGGSIENNKIGYRGDSLDSTNAVKTIADKLKGVDGTGKNGNFPMTNTAGGVIFTDKATATIAGGHINGNRADAGGIIVTEEAYVKFTSGQINSNIGVHHAGAAQVEHGGTLVMDGANAEMKNNIAWYKGGAVWATEWGTSGYAVADWSKWPREFPTLYTDRSERSEKGGGNFVLKNGTIQNNTAFARGGAIEVESNGVQLEGGLIDSNYCRSLGGAIYIEGDSPNYSYTLVLPKGYITGNTAVLKTSATGNNYKDENALLDRKIGDQLNTTTGSWLVSNTNPGDNFDRDFNGALGNGGGIWLCPVGGTSVFTGGDIYIWDNDAERNKGGEDFYLHKGNGAAMLQSHNLQGSWKNEATNAIMDKNLGVVSGPLSMTNETTNYSTGSNGVVISNNIARDGGAIACNGTFIIGEAEDVHRFNSRIDMTKTWEDGTEPAGKTINLKLQYRSINGNWEDLKYVSADADANGNPIEGVYEVDLNGQVQNDDQVGVSDVISETAPIDSNTWRATAFLPLYVIEKNSQNQDVKTYLYTLKNPKKANYSGESGFNTLDVLDLSNEAHVGHLYKYIDEEKKAGRTPSIEVANWNLQIVETLKGDNKTYNCNITYPNTGTGSGYAEPIILHDPITGSELKSFQITYSTVTFGAALSNSLNTIDIALYKKDNFGVAVSGAEFVLCEAHQDASGDYRFAGAENAWGTTPHQKTYNDDSVKITSATSGSNGYLELTNVAPGKTYFLFENNNPNTDKYQDHTSPWLIKVDEQGGYTVHAIDSTKKNLVKYGSGNNTKVYDDKKVHYKWWDDDWFSSENSTTLENDWKFASAKIKKTSKDGTTPLANVKFAFGDVAWKNNDASTETLFAGSGGLIKSGGSVVIEESNENGVIDLSRVIKSLVNTSNPGGLQGSHIDSGKRTLFMYEVKSGTKHKVKTAPWLIVIEENGDVTIKEYKDCYVFDKSPVAENGRWQHTANSIELAIADFGNTSDKVSNGTATAYATVKNDPVTVDITKVNSMDANKPVVGAKFVLNKVSVSDGGGEYYVTGTRQKDRPASSTILATHNTLTVTVDGKTTFETNNQGKISFTAPEPGKYFLFEYDVPYGYNLAKSPWLIEVSENYDVTVKAINPSYYGKYTTNSTQSSSKDRNPLLVYNTWWTKSWYDGSQSNTTITNEPVTIKKVGEDSNGLAGAEFSIWTVSYQENRGAVSAIKKLQNLNEIYGADAFVSDTNGYIDISPLFNHLTNDNYTRFLLYEENAPEGYKKPNAPWMIAIKNSDPREVKIWANGDPNNDFGSDWIPYSNYCNATAYIRNTKDPDALYKKDAESLNTLLNGAKFDLYAATKKQNCYWTSGWYSQYVCEDVLEGGKHIVTRGKLLKSGIESGKNTDKGKIVFGDIILPDGYLLLYETDAPEEYIKASTPWILVIENNKIKDIQKCKTPYQEPYVNHDSNTEWKLKDFESTGTNKYVTNYKDYELPKTGGMGTYWFMIIGAMMMGFALTAGFTKMNLINIFRR